MRRQAHFSVLAATNLLFPRVLYGSSRSIVCRMPGVMKHISSSRADGLQVLHVFFGLRWALCRRGLGNPRCGYQPNTSNTLNNPQKSNNPTNPGESDRRSCVVVGICTPSLGAEEQGRMPTFIRELVRALYQVLHASWLVFCNSAFEGYAASSYQFSEIGGEHVPAGALLRVVDTGECLPQ